MAQDLEWNLVAVRKFVCVCVTHTHWYMYVHECTGLDCTCRRRWVARQASGGEHGGLPRKMQSKSSALQRSELPRPRPRLEAKQGLELKAQFLAVGFRVQGSNE